LKPGSTAPEPRPRAQGWRAAMLALVSGYVDGYSLFNYKVYASFMSGNTTSGGLRAGQGRWADAAHDLLPVPPFVIGIWVGAILPHDARHPLRRHCALVAALVSVGVGMSGLGIMNGAPSLILYALAMGVLSSTITRVGGQPVGVGFVTGDLSKLGEHLALTERHVPVSDSRGSWDTRWWRAALLCRVWGFFLLGAFLAGAALAPLAHWVLLPPIVLLSVLAVCDRDKGWQAELGSAR
jgi:uncharacterized membrane protein YoaK (UPF0700 family)